MPSWDKEAAQCIQRSVWALATPVKIPLLRKLPSLHPHTAALHSSAPARSHCGDDHPSQGSLP